MTDAIILVHTTYGSTCHFVTAFTHPLLLAFTTLYGTFSSAKFCVHPSKYRSMDGTNILQWGEEDFNINTFTL